MITKLIPTELVLSTLLLRSQDSVRPIAWCVIGLCAGIYLFFNGFRLLRRRHLILDTPVSKIRSASIGMVELSGLAVGPYTMAAPITQRPCYYYRTIVWEWKRRGRSNQWVEVAAECMHVPFFLDDNTGKVMVDPRRAELDLHRDYQQEFCDSFFTLKEEAPPNVHSFLSRHGISTSNKIKVEEFCIKPKNALFLLGTLDENPGLELTPRPISDEEYHTLTLDKTLWFNPAQSELGRTALSFVTGGSVSTPVEERSVSERLFGSGNLNVSGFDQSGFDQSSFDQSSFDHLTSGYPALTKSLLEEELTHAAAAKVIRLSPEAPSTKIADMTQQQKIAAALLRAGISNPAAWAASGVTDSGATANPAPNGSSESSALVNLDGFDPRPPVVLMKGKNNPTFLISWRSQRDLARSLGWKCTLMIWGGPALFLLCLYLLLILTHSL